jgi:hypothetical protein
LSVLSSKKFIVVKVTHLIAADKTRMSQHDTVCGITGDLLGIICLIRTGFFLKLSFEIGA